jgi:4-carboxymuconolactone decarboxylase
MVAMVEPSVTNQSAEVRNPASRTKTCNFPPLSAYSSRMSDHYYHARDLGKFGEVAENAGELGKKFFEWYGAVFQDGALTAREKSLIALAVSHAVQCPYCIDAYATDALEKGADLDQMTEAVHVAAAIRGGASLVHAVQMRNKVQKISM